MTQIDTWGIYREQEHFNKCTSIHANNGLITYRFKDGSTEVWQKNYFGRLKRIKRRNNG